jgi:hypothetical protein
MEGKTAVFAVAPWAVAAAAMSVWHVGPTGESNWYWRTCVKACTMRSVISWVDRRIEPWQLDNLNWSLLIDEHWMVASSLKWMDPGFGCLVAG